MTITIQDVTEPTYPPVDTTSDTGKLCKILADSDFSFLPSQLTYRLLSARCFDLNNEWRCFADSWNNLIQDEYMADGGTYRFRRHAVYLAPLDCKVPVLQLPQPHYQTKTDDRLNGGVARHFAPIESSTQANEIFQSVIKLCLSVFSKLNPYYGWHIEAHQFRIQAFDTKSYPTPEGVHRDGVNFVFMMLVKRHLITGGKTSICDRLGTTLAKHTLIQEMEAVLLNDDWVTHGVSPIAPSLSDTLGYRDILVITFRKL